MNFFFDLVFLVTPLDPPLSLPPSLYPPPLEVGPLAIPAYKSSIEILFLEAESPVSQQKPNEK